MALVRPEAKLTPSPYVSYDQGQVAQSALEFSVLPNLPDSNSKKVCQDLAADILEYTTRDLRSPDGGFYSAEDADSGESLEHPEKHIGAYLSSENVSSVSDIAYRGWFLRLGKGMSARPPHRLGC